LLEHERESWKTGIQRLAGMDEAGRGPLAGPVVAAAVVIDRCFLEEQEHGLLADLTDSKQLTERQRESFYALLSSSQHVRFGLGSSGPDEIDSINILNATHVAMARALLALPEMPEHVLVDGLAVKGLPCPSTPIVRGDGASLLIAAASVIAKVTRDRLMKRLDVQYPGYGFARHKGYGSRMHMLALLELGPSPVHRRTFRPVREAAVIRERKESPG